MGVSVPGRKLAIPVRLPCFTASTTFGRDAVPSGIVKLQRHAPSSGWTGFSASSSAAPRGQTKERSNKTRLVAIGPDLMLCLSVRVRRFGRRHTKPQRNLFFVLIIPATIGDIDSIPLVRNG